MTLLRGAPGLIQNLYKFVMLLFFFAMMVFIPSPASAEEEPSVVDWVEDREQQNSQPEDRKSIENGVSNQNEEPSLVMIIGQLIFYTLIILVLIYALIKFLALKQKKMQPNQAISMIGGTSLGTNKSLQLVKVGGTVYLIGVADQITLIKEISNKEEIKLIENDMDRQPAFFSNSWLGLRKKNSSKKETGKFEQLFNQSLTNQRNKQNQLQEDLYEENEEGRGKK